jgi:hypothetical protein
MALRIGGGAKQIPQDMNLQAQDEGDAAAQEMAEPQAEEQSEAPDAEASEQPAQGGGVLDPQTAGYKTPDQGPFICRNCVHYGVGGDGTCEIVSGPIDEEGVCNVFTSGKQQQPGQEASPDSPLLDEQPMDQSAQEEPTQQEAPQGY